MLPNDITWLRSVFEVKWGAIELMVSDNFTIAFETALKLTSSLKSVLGLKSDEGGNWLGKWLRVLLLQIVYFLVDLGEVAELSSSDRIASLLEKTDELRVLEGESDVCNSDWSQFLFRIKHAWLGWHNSLEFILQVFFEVGSFGSCVVSVIGFEFFPDHFWNLILNNKIRNRFSANIPLLEFNRCDWRKVVAASKKEERNENTNAGNK